MNYLELFKKSNERLSKLKREMIKVDRELARMKEQNEKEIREHEEQQ